jgi:alpha-tubulin suppressor-like RCC1 family protein
LVEALAGKKVVGVAAGCNLTVTWTDAGELFTFGCGGSGKLGHGEEENVPRLVEA